MIGDPENPQLPFDALVIPPEALDRGGVEVLRAAIVDGGLHVSLRRAFDDCGPQDFHAPVLERGGRDLEGIERRHQFFAHTSFRRSRTPVRRGARQPWPIGPTELVTSGGDVISASNAELIRASVSACGKRS